MRLCKGGELLDKILSRGGRYTEEDAKVIVVQILSVIAYCHLQDVVHCDLKPENFLFATREEDASVRVIDFGLSDFIRPGQAVLLQSYINQVCARRWVVLCSLPLLEANEEKATESTNNLPRL